MKYIKIYENFQIDKIYKIYQKFKTELGNILNEYKPMNWKLDYSYQDSSMKNVGLSIKHCKNYHNDLIIKFFEVSDKKQRDKEIPEKMKIEIECREKSLTDITDIFDILKNTMKKYSYFSKDHKIIYWNCSDFYIKTSDMDNILNDLKNNFEIYKDTKKYNL